VTPATENVNSLLYLKGVDAAIINTDVLDEYRAQVPHIERRIVYLLSLFPSELHIFVRPEIHSLEDLKGKKVNFNTQGTAAAYSGPLIFSRLGLNVEKMFIPHQVALEQMRHGDVSAVVFVTSKPVDAFLKRSKTGDIQRLPACGISSDEPREYRVSTRRILRMISNAGATKETAPAGGCIAEICL
jgi:TRAP-type uncharacterized transport system substrate-binding protein